MSTPSLTTTSVATSVPLVLLAIPILVGKTKVTIYYFFDACIISSPCEKVRLDPPHSKVQTRHSNVTRWRRKTCFFFGRVATGRWGGGIEMGSVGNPNSDRAEAIFDRPDKTPKKTKVERRTEPKSLFGPVSQFVIVCTVPDRTDTLSTRSHLYSEILLSFLSYPPALLLSFPFCRRYANCGLSDSFHKKKRQNKKEKVTKKNASLKINILVLLLLYSYMHLCGGLPFNYPNPRLSTFLGAKVPHLAAL